MAKKLSKQATTEALVTQLFKLYLAEHGGQEKQPYLVMCWISGRFDELLQWAKDQEAIHLERLKK